VRRWLADDRGQALTEYALVISVIGVTAVIAMMFFRQQLGTLFSNIANEIRNY
jgi:Flp pilus assembly pilin Flp